MASLAGWKGDVWVTSTPSVVATNETCNDDGDHINYRAATHKWWDSTKAFTVQSDGWPDVYPKFVFSVLSGARVAADSSMAIL